MKSCHTDMRFVKKITPPDFQAKNFTPSISPNFNSFSDKNTRKWVKMEKFPPLANSTSAQPHAASGLGTWLMMIEMDLMMILMVKVCCREMHLIFFNVRRWIELSKIADKLNTGNEDCYQPQWAGRMIRGDVKTNFVTENVTSLEAPFRRRGENVTVKYFLENGGSSKTMTWSI